MADTTQQLHPLIQDIWTKHDRWLEEGGAGAMRRIQEANMINFMSQGLYEAEGMGYKRGWEDGYRVGYSKAGEQQRRAADPSEPPPAPDQPALD